MEARKRWEIVLPPIVDTNENQAIPIGRKQGRENHINSVGWVRVVAGLPQFHVLPGSPSILRDDQLLVCTGGKPSRIAQEGHDFRSKWKQASSVQCVGFIESSWKGSIN